MRQFINSLSGTGGGGGASQPQINIDFSDTVETTLPIASIPAINIISNGNYLSFGTIIFNPLNSNQILYFIREGIHPSDAHNLGGRLVKIIFDLSTNKRSDVILIYEESGIDLRDAEVLVIGNDIYLWLSRKLEANGAHQSLSYIKSSDGGVTWGTKVDVLTIANSWTTTGNPVPKPGNINVLAFGKGFQHGTDYYQPYYDSEFGAGDDQERSMLLKTSDSGLTWQDVEVVQTLSSSELPWNECAWVDMGSNQIIGISRRSGGNLWQIETTDFVTFTTPVATGLSVGTSMADLLMRGSDLFCFFQQRNDGRVKYSKTTPATIWQNPTSWPASIEIFDNTDDLSPPGLGYPTVLDLGSNEFFIAWSHEVDVLGQRTADVYFRIIQIL